ncbi:MAG: MFS transporter [Halochromatium sp.]
MHTQMTNARLIDFGVLEWRFPVLLESFSIRDGSGGAGRHCGRGCNAASNLPRSNLGRCLNSPRRPECDPTKSRTTHMNGIRQADRPVDEPQSPVSGSPLIKLSALFIAVAMLVIGNGLSGTLVSVRAVGEGMSSVTIGWIMSAYFFGFAVGSSYASRLIEAVGHIRAFAALASICSALAIAYPLIIAPAVWFLFRLLFGVCYAGLVVVIESWLNASAERDQRGRILGLYNFILVLGYVASQSLLTLAPTESFMLFAATSILLSLALVPITLTRAGVPGKVAADRVSMKRLLDLSPLGFAGAFVVGTAMSAFWGMGPVFATRVGFEDEGIALFMAITMSGALAFTWPLGRLSDKIDRRLVIIFAGLIAALAALTIVVLEERTSAALLGAGFVFGGFAIPIYSISIAHVNDRIAEGEVVAVASRLVLIYGAGAALGPLLASASMRLLGTQGLFVYISATFGMLVLFGLVRLGFRGEGVLWPKRGFIIVPRTTHVSLQLHRDRRGQGPGRSAPA